MPREYWYAWLALPNGGLMVPAFATWCNPWTQLKNKEKTSALNMKR